MIDFPNKKEEEFATRRRTDKLYQLEDLGLIEFTPQKFGTEMEMAFSFKSEKLEEWLDNRTIGGKKLPKKQSLLVDDVIFTMFFMLRETGNKEIDDAFLNIFKKRLGNPKFKKYFDKNLGKVWRERGIIFRK